MNTARNPITGALLKTKPATNSYRDNYDAIFGKKAEPVVTEAPVEEKQKKPKKK